MGGVSFSHQPIHLPFAMTGNQMLPFGGLQGGLHFAALVHDKGTTGMEMATFGGIQWAGHISGEDNPAGIALNLRYRYARKQGVGVRVEGI